MGMAQTLRRWAVGPSTPRALDPWLLQAVSSESDLVIRVINSLEGGDNCLGCFVKNLFKERAARADSAAVDRILAHVGTEPPRPGDEMPENVDLDAIRTRLRTDE